MDLTAISNLFKAIGDPTRLRMIHLLCAGELTVGELVRILDLPQSTVSRHLKTLREHGMLADRPVGASTYYRASLEADHGQIDTAIRDTLVGMLKDSPLPPADRKRLDQALALREREGEEFFDRVGLRWDALREACFGPTFHLEAFIHLLPREWTVADMGTGTGYLLPQLGRHFQKVIGVDRSRSMLDLAAHRIRGGQDVGIELRQGELEALPIADGEADLALAMILLHHLPDVTLAAAEVARILKPGGRVLIVDIHPHDNEQFRVRMADRRRGLDAGQLTAWLTEAGFVDIEPWDYPYTEHPEHELAPLPRLYGLTGKKG